MSIIAAPQSKDFQILIVDDEPDLLDMLAYDLGRIGYRVETATGGTEAFQKFKDGSFHLIITDIRMPQGDGLALLKKVKELNAQLPVICITGYSETSNSHIMDLGAVAVFEKPFDIKKLRALLADIFGIKA